MAPTLLPEGVVDRELILRPQHSRRLSRLLSWGERGAFTVLDQGLFATANFVTSVLLARWLQPADYGTFAVLYSAFALLSTIHAGFLCEPLLVYGSGRYSQHKDSYLGAVVSGHWVLVAGLSMVLFAVGISWLLISRSTAIAILSLAVATPFMLYRLLGKTASYAVLSPRLAAIAAAVYMILMLPGIFLVYWAGWLTSAIAFGLMGLASLGSGLVVFIRLGLVRAPIRKNPLGRKVIRDHWVYGRWAAATGILIWVPGQIYYLALPILIDLEAAAQLRALTNLIMPVSHTFSAIGFLLVPALVRLRRQDHFVRVLIFGMALFTALAALYWLVLGFFSEPIMLWLYKGQYGGSSQLLWLVGLIPIATGNVVWLGAALRAFERPNAVFWSYVLSSSTTITVGLLLMMQLGLKGSILGMIAASATTAVAMTWFLFIKKAKPREVETRV